MVGLVLIDFAGLGRVEGERLGSGGGGLDGGCGMWVRGEREEREGRSWVIYHSWRGG